MEPIETRPEPQLEYDDSQLWLELRNWESEPPLTFPSYATCIHRNSDTASDVASPAA